MNKRVLVAGYKKAGLMLMIKKRLRLRAKPHTKPLLMAQSLFEAKAITISQLLLT
ncbi:hypothetical protein [Helicobacter pylori]|uniref:hypothetical protein n=1 Tax=Helicobacter pylori TaxID=210 RepID=UPI0012B38F1D|nr:hypothetical protein [Helicobacter pylori]